METEEGKIIGVEAKNTKYGQPMYIIKLEGVKDGHSAFGFPPKWAQVGKWASIRYDVSANGWRNIGRGESNIKEIPPILPKPENDNKRWTESDLVFIWTTEIESNFEVAKIIKRTSDAVKIVRDSMLEAHTTGSTGMDFSEKMKLVAIKYPMSNYLKENLKRKLDGKKLPSDW